MTPRFIGQQTWPTNVPLSAAAQTGAEIVMGGFVAIMVAWGIRNIVARRDPALLICMIGGLLTCVMEPNLMRLYKFFYPQVGQHTLFYGFGQPVPIYLALCYSAFLGPSAYFLMRTQFVRSFDARSFFIGMIAVVIAEVALEVVCVRFGVWLYFGDQPFTVGDFPVHVAVIIGCAMVILGSVSRIWFDRFGGAAQWWMVPISPLMMLGVFSVFAYPVGLAMNSAGGIGVARIGSLLSMALALAASFVAAKELARVPDIARR